MDVYAGIFFDDLEVFQFALVLMFKQLKLKKPTRKKIFKKSLFLKEIKL
jgi:hypothetical protein